MTLEVADAIDDFKISEMKPASERYEIDVTAAASNGHLVVMEGRLDSVKQTLFGDDGQQSALARPSLAHLQRADSAGMSRFSSVSVLVG